MLLEAEQTRVDHEFMVHPLISLPRIALQIPPVNAEMFHIMLIVPCAYQSHLHHIMTPFLHVLHSTFFSAVQLFKQYHTHQVFDGKVFAWLRLPLTHF